MTNENISYIKLGVKGLLVLVVIWIIASCFTIVPPTDNAIITRMGAINRVVTNGPHFKIPFFEEVILIDMSEQKNEVSSAGASKDLQNVYTNLAVNFAVGSESVIPLYLSSKGDYYSRIIAPAVQEAVKATTAKYTAEEVVTKRELVKDDITNLLRQKLSPTGIRLVTVSITDFKFSKSYEEAIEAKVTAEQTALTEKNNLETQKFKAEQRIAQAKGEAEAIRIQAQAIQSQGGAEYVRLKTIEKWNGMGCTSYCGLESSTGLLISGK